MKILRHTWNNYGSFYGTHSVELSDQGLVFVSGWNHDAINGSSPSNGSGKSTLFDSLEWGLFGEVPRGDTAKSVVNDEVNKDCWTVTHLQDSDQTEYRIFRSRAYQKQNTTRLFSKAPTGEWVNETAMDASETQRKIEAALGLDRTIFRTVVYRAQGAGTTFLDGTDADRKTLLTALIPELQAVDTQKERIRARIDQLQIETGKDQAKRQQAEQELAGLKAQDWSSAQQIWQSSQQVKISAAQQGYQVAVSDLELTRQEALQLTGLTSALASLHRTGLPAPDRGPVDLATAALYDAKNGIRDAEQAYKRLSAEQADLQGLTGQRCSKCNALVDPAHVALETARIQKELDLVIQNGKQARQVLQHAEGQLSQVSAQHQQQLSAHQTEQAQRQQEIGALQVQIQSAQKATSRLAEIEGRVQGWTFHLHGLTAEQWPGAALQQAAQHRIAELSEWLVGVAQEGAAREQLLVDLRFWDDACSAKALKSLILDSRIEQMTTAANEWVQALTGGTCWVRFETQSLTAAGKLTEKFNVRVYQHNRDGTVSERNYQSWSGGEKTRVALGVDRGLTSLVAERATKAWQFLVLDESFRQHLDEGGRESVFGLIQKLNLGSVFVVDHDNAESYFQDVLTVQKKDRRSTVYRGGACLVPPSTELQHYLPPGF